MSDAFITGSRAYGTPREDSDIDLVILCNEDVAGRLRELADAGDEFPASVAGPNSFSIRFGKLNIIACFDKKVYDLWRQGTLELQYKSGWGLHSPISRDDAIAHFDKLRNELGVNYK